MTGPLNAKSQQQQQQAPPQSNTTPWQQTWQDFQRALCNPHDNFNPFMWIGRLGHAGWLYFYHTSGLQSVVNQYQLYRAWSPAWIPWGVTCLVTFLVLVYWCSMRQMFVHEWCGNSNNNCHWVLLWHDGLAVYFPVLIFYHYFRTCLISPGVALPTGNQNDNQLDTNRWSFWNGQGGFVGKSVHCNAPLEQERVKLYQTINCQGNYEKTTTLKATTDTKSSTVNQSSKPSTTTLQIPSPDSTTCDKCIISQRPPRCHHCKICQRCILQFDHHCYWLNTCIGRYNYGHFIALIVHLTLACWYCLAVLIVPFYALVQQEQMRQQQQIHMEMELESDIPSFKANGFIQQWYLFYLRSQLFQGISKNPVTLLHLMLTDNLPYTTATKLVYPLLLGIGIVMTLFLGTHLRYIRDARTTLEHKIVLERQYDSLWQQLQHQQNGSMQKESKLSITNPFDQGSFGRNWDQIMGVPPWRLLLPLPIQPPPPYLPHHDTNVIIGSTTNNAANDSKKIKSK